MIVGNIIGGSPVTPKTYIFETEFGQEVPGVLDSSEQILTATPNDIREGSVAVTDAGITTGTKVIPSYHTVEGYRLITNGSKVTIPNMKPEINSYDYTKLQAMICLYNTQASNSVSTEKVSIEDKVYAVNSVDVISNVTKDHDLKRIDLGVTNDSGSLWIVRFFMYKEIK